MAVTGIHIVPSHQVNAGKWDACIAASHGLIYATHLWLQHMADNWSGIVVNDYEAVMPVIWRKKLGIKYMYDAPFIQQLGMYGKYTSETLKDATLLSFRQFRYGDLHVNYTNNVNVFLPGARQTTNLVLYLDKAYETLTKNYTAHLRRKLHAARKQDIQCTVTNNIDAVVNTFEQLYATQLPLIKTRHYKALANLAKTLQPVQKCFVKQVTDPGNRQLAVALFFKDGQRIYNILPATTAEGRTVSAMHFLIDNIIREYAETPYILDFEGSEQPGIKAFYQSFGAFDQPYYSYHYNNLQMPLKWLKR